MTGDRWRAGDRPDLDGLNRWRENAHGARYASGEGWEAVQTPDGAATRHTGDGPRPRLLRLSGGGPAYSAVVLRDHPGTEADTDAGPARVAHEVNGLAGLDGRVAIGWPDGHGAYRFQWCASGGRVPPIGIGIPGCLCKSTPFELALSVTYGPGETSASYGNAYRSCVLGYFREPPPYMPASAFSGAGYYSTTAWEDDYGFTDYFRLNCYSTQYALGFGQSNQGNWLAPGQIYNWSMGGRPAVNFCDPFALNVGRPQSGVFFNGKIVVTG